MVVGPTHARGGTLDLLMTDVPDFVWVAVVTPIGNSDHSSLLAVISMAQAVPNLCVSRKVFLKHQVNWNTVCGTIRELPGRNIWLSAYSMGIGGSVFSILTQLLSNQSQHVMMDGCRIKLVNVVSGVPQGSVLGPLLLLLYTSELFPFWNIS